MKITYRREMKHNYLIVDPEALTWRSYECRMLAANSIEGVLHFQIRQVDDEIRFYYEITSRQPLDRMLESGGVRTEELRSLVFGISRVLDRMEQYLLPEGCVLLTPDYIYVEPETFRIWLCLVPGLERNFPEDYGKLLEYLLGKVDHQDKDSVVLAYGLYQETRKENYGMEDILRLFGRDQERDPGMSEEVTEGQERLCLEESEGGNGAAAESQSSREESHRGAPWGSRREHQKDSQRDFQRRGQRDHQKNSLKGRERAGIWGRLRAWWSRRRGEESGDPVQVPWEMMFHDEDEDEGKSEPLRAGQRGGDWGAQPLKSPNRPEREVKAPELPRPEGRPGQDTVLLADLAPDNRTKLHCLRALDGDGENITLSYYPFIIGKQENLVDHLLPYDTVSRLHLRIDREGEQYFVQDLNSTNGTTVEGRLLENNESAEIHEGDEIHIARYRYRFE